MALHQPGALLLTACASTARHVPRGPPQEAARALREEGLEEEWVVEVYRGEVLTLVPRGDEGPLEPVAEAALRGEYEGLLLAGSQSRCRSATR